MGVLKCPLITKYRALMQFEPISNGRITFFCNITPTQDPEEEKMQPISGEDTTGRNKAERVYPTIEKSIIDYYGELDNPEDQEYFYDYLIANMKLYFDKWDGESATQPPEEPTNDEYEKAKQSL